jgi:hypothetical protein
MIFGLFWMIVAQASVFLASHVLWRKIRCGDPAVDVVLFLLVRLLLISALVVAAGLTGLLAPLPLGLVCAAALLILLATGQHLHLRRPSRPEIGTATLVLLALLGLRMALQVWFTAPFVGDVHAYHLPKVAEWIRAGGFTREMGLDPCVTFPAGFEIVETWWVVFLRHDVLIEMGGVEFAVLAFAAVVALSRKAGFSPGAAALAGALYLLTPLFNLQAIACLNDAPVAAVVLSIVALTFARVHPAVLFIPLALGAGIKGTAIYALPGVALLAWLQRREPLLRPSSLRWAVSLAVVAAAVGGYWYLRNLVWFGNPTHPMTRGGFDLGGVHVQAGPHWSSLTRNLHELLGDRIYDRNGSYQADAYRESGWGVLVFSVGILGLILGIREDRSVRVLAAAFGVSLLSVFTLVSTDGWYMRFVLFFPAIVCLGAARLAERSRPIAALVAAVAAIQFVATLIPADTRAPRMAAMAKQPWRERSAAPWIVGDALPPSEPLALYSTLRTTVYMFYGPDFSRRIVYLRVRNAAEMREEMVRQGVRYVYVDLRSHHRKADIDAMVKAGTLRALTANLHRLE